LKFEWGINSGNKLNIGLQTDDEDGDAVTQIVRRVIERFQGLEVPKFRLCRLKIVEVNFAHNTPFRVSGTIGSCHELYPILRFRQGGKWFLKNGRRPREIDLKDWPAQDALFGIYEVRNPAPASIALRSRC
jgi:hypothetical protein